MVFSSYFIFRNRYKVAFFISFLLTSGLLLIFSRIPVKEAKIKDKPIVITLTQIIDVPVKEPVKEEIIEDKVVKEEVVEDEILEEEILKEEVIEEAIQEKIPDEQANEESIVKELIEVPGEVPVIEQVTAKEETESYIDIDDLPDSTVIVEPKYPKTAIKWDMEGTVEIEILIYSTGKLNQINILKSSGHKVLDNECLKTIKKKWKLPNLGHEYKVFKRFVFVLDR